MNVPRAHQIKIAQATIRMSKEGALIAGGMNHKEAIRILRSIYPDSQIRYDLSKAGHEDKEIEKFMRP